MIRNDKFNHLTTHRPPQPHDPLLHQLPTLLLSLPIGALSTLHWLIRFVFRAHRLDRPLHILPMTRHQLLLHPLSLLSASSCDDHSRLRHVRDTTRRLLYDLSSRYGYLPPQLFALVSRHHVHNLILFQPHWSLILCFDRVTVN